MIAAKEKITETRRIGKIRFTSIAIIGGKVYSKNPHHGSIYGRSHQIFSQIRRLHYSVYAWCIIILINV